MKDLSSKIKNKIIDFENNGLDTELRIVLRENKPFTELITLKELEELDLNTEIDGNEYFTNLNQILNNLIQNIDENKNEIDTVLQVFQKYVSDEEYEAEELNTTYI